MTHHDESHEELLKRLRSLHGLHYQMLNDQHEVTVTPDIMEWVAWANNPANWTVGHEKDEDGNLWVSTVFLHGTVNRYRSKTPFETMVFGGEYNNQSNHYATWAEALVGHYMTVNRLKTGRSPFGDDAR